MSSDKDLLDTERGDQPDQQSVLEAANALKFIRMMSWHRMKPNRANASAPIAIDRASIATTRGHVWRMPA
jgi:hypothetical protein